MIKKFMIHNKNQVSILFYNPTLNVFYNFDQNFKIENLSHLLLREHTSEIYFALINILRNSWICYSNWYSNFNNVFDNKKSKKQY